MGEIDFIRNSQVNPRPERRDKPLFMFKNPGWCLSWISGETYLFLFSTSIIKGHSRIYKWSSFWNVLSRMLHGVFKMSFGFGGTCRSILHYRLFFSVPQKVKERWIYQTVAFIRKISLMDDCNISNSQRGS